MQNNPKMKVGIVAVSRDCFPESLSVNRRKALVTAYEKKYGKGDIYECPVCIVESEVQMREALADLEKEGCNALCVYLGNFGPEISETMLAKEYAQRMNAPVMFCAAAEEDIPTLADSRGDAYCGMLNASYNLKLRGVQAYIPEYPVGDAEECADMIHAFLPVARAVYAVKRLKLITFGPRPMNFLACNAPIQQLYNLGVEVEENSELDLFEAFHKHAGDKRIPEVVADMEKELGAGNKKPEILAKLAQYELTLLDWVEAHKGSREYVAIAGKCWPAFQTQFGFVPCYVNSRLTGRGIPVSCEVDIYGALSEFIGTVVSEDAVTLLDINNTVPKDLYNEGIAGKFDYKLTDTFMGFHCGNTCAGKICRGQNLQARDEVPEDHGAFASRGSHERHARGRHRTRQDHLLPSAKYGRQQAARVRCGGRSAARAHAFLRFDRYLRDPRDEALLSPCAHRGRVPSSRRGRVRALRQGALRSLQVLRRSRDRVQSARRRPLSDGKPVLSAYKRRNTVSRLRFAAGYVRSCTRPLQSRALLVLLASLHLNHRRFL